MKVLIKITISDILNDDLYVLELGNFYIFLEKAHLSDKSKQRYILQRIIKLSEC